MGSKRLKKVLTKLAPGCFIRGKMLSDYCGKSIGIDASNIIYRFAIKILETTNCTIIDEKENWMPFYLQYLIKQYRWQNMV